MKIILSNKLHVSLPLKAYNATNVYKCNIKLFCTYDITDITTKELQKNLDTDYDEVDLGKYMHGRGNQERRDSVTKHILLERKKHLEKSMKYSIDGDLLKLFKKHGLGQKKRRNQIYQSQQHISGVSSLRKTNTAAGGFAQYITSASKEPWPIFKHLLPEIAFAGHSNSGKSTLVNAMCGVLPTKGPAKVSERAGWTDQICFYQLGKKPPVLTLVDLPGYGHAVASAAQRRVWTEMMNQYLKSRSILSRCCILVDCTRGLCKQDKYLIRFLNKHIVPWSLIVTKADLLRPEELSQSIAVIRDDLEKLLLPISSISSKQEQHIHNLSVTEEEEVSVATSSTLIQSSDVKLPNEEIILSIDDKKIIMEEVEEDCTTTTTITSSAISDKEDINIHYGDDDSEVRLYHNKTKNILAQEGEEGEEEEEEEEEGEEEGEEKIVISHSNNDVMKLIHIVSANTGAGIQPLWNQLCKYIQTDLVASSAIGGDNSIINKAVKEHRLAHKVRNNAMFLSRATNVTTKNNHLVVASPKKSWTWGKNRRSLKRRELEEKRV